MPPLSEQSIRGIKRRRQDDKESQEDKLRRKLHHSLRELRKTVKKAKAFEVRKTLKKLKDARHKDPEGDLTKDLVDQIEVFKHVSYDQLALSALMTKLKKNKSLSTDPLVHTILTELASNLVLPAMTGTLTAKVQSRVLSCKTLASEVVSTVESLRTFLDPSLSENAGDSTHDPLNTPKRSRTGTGRGKEALSFRDSVANPIGQESNRDQGTSSGEAMAEMNDGWESGTVSGRSESDDSTSGSMNDHDDVTFEHDSDDIFSEDATANKRSRPHGPQGQSKFLPSLSVGFARGDSGSEFSDSETRLVDGTKKNRPGQRARRVIWEKRFGKNANHIKTPGTSKRRLGGSVPSDRRSGKGNLSSRPHPTPARSRAHSGDHELVPERNPPVSEGVKSSGRARRSGSDQRGKQDSPLHPSWEAKRKYKSASIVPSRGTKIVFAES